MSKKYAKIETQLIHAGEPKDRMHGAVVMPIFQSAMYEFNTEGQGYHDVKYIRLSNSPNHESLHKKLAALENAEAALVTASGMAAISTALLSVLKAGDHLLVQDCLYGGTYSFITNDFGRFGVSFDFIDANDPDSWQAKLRPNTKAIYVESLTNPLLQVCDLPAVVVFAKANHLVSLIDNTFTGPINYRPIEHGFDLSLHSATKSLNGHSDIVAGVIAGGAEHVKNCEHLLSHLGGSMDPHAAFLLHRGIKTLALRMNYQNESTLKIAQFMEQHPAVVKVNYAGLQSHPHFRRAKELFKGCGGVFSFELKGGVEAARRFIDRVKLPVIAPSLGGVETLVTRPVLTSHSGMTPEEREKAGVTDGLVRISVGIEATEDIIEDFGQALAGFTERLS
ncbi:MAG: trans-sulfuration enzyme family protein [bacterium]